MMGRFFRSGSEAADTNARRPKGEEDEDEDEELALQRSRVQLVSSRRRQSVEDDDLDSHRSSTLSHISYLSTPAISTSTKGWATPAAGPTLALQGSFRQQFHDDRCSLPTLESFRSISAGSVDIAPRESNKHRARRNRRKQASQPLPQQQQMHRESEQQPMDKADDVYYAPNSPPQSVVSSTSRVVLVCVGLVSYWKNHIAD